MNEKVKNMIHHMKEDHHNLSQSNGEVATTNLWNKLGANGSRTLKIAGALGLIGAAGLAVYMLRKKK